MTDNWDPFPERPALESVRVFGVELKRGNRVRLWPQKTADIMDMALQGQIAIIEAIEQDYDDQIHFAVVLEDDPGKDLGMLRQPGHRFFFDAEEVEPLSPDEGARTVTTAMQTILVAGIGNIFLGDDAFGEEVVRRLATRQLPQAVRVTDFGIRGFDLAYALQDGYETTILVDACPRGQAPGTLYVIEPDLESMGESVASQPVADAHAMNPVSVLRMAQAMNIEVKNLLLVGCEPDTLGSEQGQMGLSAPVESAVDDAVKLVESLISKILDRSLTKGESSSTL